MVVGGMTDLPLFDVALKPTADFPSSQELLHLSYTVKYEVCMLKVFLIKQ
jgi:hypothetical protein